MATTIDDLAPNTRKMDLSDDDDDDDEDSVHTETREQQNARICALLVPFILQTHGVKRMREVDQWRGLISPAEYGRVYTVPIDHETQFALADAKAGSCYVVSPNTAPCKVGRNALPANEVLHPETGEPLIYSLEQTYPVTMTVRRWENEFPMDLGLVSTQFPGGIDTGAIQRIMQNWGQAEAAFMRLKAHSSNSTAESQAREPTLGIAFRGRDFGVVHERYLVAFAPVRTRHLWNGCIPLPDDLMRSAKLPFLAKDVPEGTSPLDAPHVRRWYLVPTGGFVTWPIKEMTYEERIERFGVIAVGPIRSRDKNTGEIHEPYWVMTDRSLAYLIADIGKNIVDKPKPLSLGDQGVKIAPFDCMGAPQWTELAINKELHPVDSTEQQIAQTMTKPRRLKLRYYVKYVVHPIDMHEADNLCAKLPDDWPSYTTYDVGSAPPITAVPHNQQRQRV